MEWTHFRAQLSRVRHTLGNRAQVQRSGKRHQQQQLRRSHPGLPCPLSRKSVMMAALQADQGLARSIWISVGDIMWLAWSFPNTSSHTFTLSWGMLNTWPGVRQEDT